MTLDKGPANKQEASRAWERMVGVWGEGHIYKSTKSAHRSNECGFGKRLEDRRDLEWSEKEMPSLATQRNSRRESCFGRISGQQDSFWIRRAISSRKCVPKRSKPDWILSFRIWELPPGKPCFPSPENWVSSRGQQRAVESWQSGRRAKARC